MHSGYTARPDGEGPFPGLIVIHDAFGMTDHLREVCDHLAANGYLAHAPSLYQRGRCLRQVFRSFLDDDGPTYRALETERVVVAARTDCTGRVGVVGFCMGGRFALVASGRGMFDAASINYPVLGDRAQDPDAMDAMLSQPCPVVASFGGRDKVVAPTDATALRAGLDRAGVRSDVTVYPTATHSFLAQPTGALGWLFRVQGMTHDPEASADAWDRMFRFFEEHLDQVTPPRASR